MSRPMDKRSSVLIHCNPTLSNQRLYADYLNKGFQRLGYKPMIDVSASGEADLHVCIGPHFAFNHCLGKNTIYIDRCLWGDDLESVTIGWLKEDGGMLYPESNVSRETPELKPWHNRDIDKVLVLADYGPYPIVYKKLKLYYRSVTLRPHPAARAGQKPLAKQLEEVDLAVGYRTSALVTAAIHGVPVISLDNRSPVYPVAGHDILDVIRPDREPWLRNLSYAQWKGSEIQSGEALNYVLNYRQLSSGRAGNA